MYVQCSRKDVRQIEHSSIKVTRLLQCLQLSETRGVYDFPYRQLNSSEANDLVLSDHRMVHNRS